MGTPGRKPKPTAVHKLQGNPSKKKLDNTNEPRPKTRPEMPYGLKTHSPMVAKLWEQHAPEMERLGLLTGLDVGAYRLLLQHYLFALQAAKQVDVDGMFRLDENGVERKHPGMQVFRDNSEMYRKWASEFGLTPSSRSRLKMEPEAEQLSLADMLFQAAEEAAGK